MKLHCPKNAQNIFRMKLGQNFVKYFVRFLGNGVSSINAFEIYWPLATQCFFQVRLQICFQWKTVEYTGNISQIYNVGAATEGLMGINIPRKKLFFQWECCRQDCWSLGGYCLCPPRFWQISLPYLNQGWQIMSTKLLIASPRFSDLPTVLA